MRVFSFRSHADIEELEAATADRPHAREAQRALAAELTTLVHGAAATQAVVTASAALFGRGELTESDPSILAAALAEAGVTVLTPADVAAGSIPFLTVLARSGLVAGTSAARRAVAEGGAYLNNERVTDIERQITAADLLHGRWVVLRRGKRQIAAADAAVLVT